MMLLLSDLDLHNWSRLSTNWRHHQIPYRVEADGKRIMVAADDVFHSTGAAGKGRIASLRQHRQRDLRSRQ